MPGFRCAAIAPVLLLAEEGCANAPGELGLAPLASIRGGADHGPALYWAAAFWENGEPARMRVASAPLMRTHREQWERCLSQPLHNGEIEWS